MREILFRGKRADDGAWVYGWPCRYPFGMWPLKDAIIPSEDAEGGYHRFVEVDPSTVGQYTGLTDKNGRRIFEGDLLVLATNRTHEVKFADGSFYMNGTCTSIHYAGKFTIVGNRWDNPELLEGMENDHRTD